MEQNRAPAFQPHLDELARPAPGRPLESHETIVELIAAATTRTGLKVQAQLDDGDYPNGIKITDQQMEALPLSRHDFHGNWN